jgi:hypothetical protein
MKNTACVVLLMLILSSALAQIDSTSNKKKKLHGTFYVTWGYQKILLYAKYCTL